jgi:hypothetical protein
MCVINMTLPCSYRESETEAAQELYLVLSKVPKLTLGIT